MPSRTGFSGNIHYGPGGICGLSLLLVLVLAPRVFLWVLWFSTFHINQHFLTVDEEPLRGNATANSHYYYYYFIIIIIIIIILNKVLYLLLLLSSSSLRRGLVRQLQHAI